jgi:uncharacterized protein (DUF608 family)
MNRRTWPVLTAYKAESIRKIALPIGGIGTGTVSLGGKGDLRDWEIMNRPAKGFQPQYSFFCIRVAEPGGKAKLKILEGPIDTSEYEGAYGSRSNHHGLPRFQGCTFEAAYPLGQVVLEDDTFPVKVHLRAFNPLIPTELDKSSIPMAVLRYEVTNSSTTDQEVTISGNLQNFIGEDGSSELIPNAHHPFRDGFQKFNNFNSYRESGNVKGIFFDSKGVDKESERYGTIALAILDSVKISYRTRWANYSWGDSLLEFWDDLTLDGELTDSFASTDSIFDENSSTLSIKPGELPAPVASLADKRLIRAGRTEEYTFLITWNFPNRHAWMSTDYGDISQAQYSDDVVGNHYSKKYHDAWNVVLETKDQLECLEEETIGFVNSICEAGFPSKIAEAALFNLSTLRSQTFFQTHDGHFYGWEGTGDHKGSCHGSCTHVWNYEQATPHLFGAIAQDMRELEFSEAMHADGLMSFRIGLPLDKYSKEWSIAAADGQMGCIVKLYREWRLSGDDVWLKKLWPSARRALEFCWIPGGWDADQDGVMEGAQHNTMDVEYYGPNPQMGLWYLAALKACVSMAQANGEFDFGSKCLDLFENGSSWIDRNLFNGEYYIHKIVPPGDISLIHPGLRHASMGAANMTEPELQLGEGCLVDQLVGQFLAHICGLGYLVNPENQKKTLQSIIKYNSRSEFFSEFNHMRNFVLGDEQALLMASYREGARPERPFPYFNEVMTGFEYTAAIGMIYEGMEDLGIKVISNIRSRYDGYKRNPFDEAECGHHYARAMASWAAILALTGQQYDGRTGTLTLKSLGKKPLPWFTGHAWGTISEVDSKIVINVKNGKIKISEILVGGEKVWSPPQILILTGPISTTIE